MMKSLRRGGRHAPTTSVGRPGAKPLFIAVAGLAAYGLWTYRNRLAKLVTSLLDHEQFDAKAEQAPDDYDWNRPSVRNSTAMAGPVNGTGELRGVDGGTMGTDLGSQGDGAV